MPDRAHAGALGSIGPARSMRVAGALFEREPKLARNLDRRPKARL